MSGHRPIPKPGPGIRHLLGAVALALVAALPAGARADSMPIGDLVLYDAWARATPGRAANGAAYVTIHSHATAPDRLLEATTPVAERVEPHTHDMAGGIMRMRKLDALIIDGGSRVALAPGGIHLMLMGLKGPLREGDTFPMRVRFQNAGAATVQVRVLGVGAKGPAPGTQGHHHGDKHGAGHGAGPPGHHSGHK